METIRQVISKSAKRKMSSGNRVKAGSFTQQVVYKTPVGKRSGKTIYKSVTKHEIVS